MRKEPRFSRMITFSSILVTAIILFAFILIISVSKRYNEVSKRIHETIGSHVVIEGDTLLVTGYVVWDNVFILKNGTQISAKLLDDLEVIP